MERFFQILAVILAGIAAYFIWQGNADRAFASAVFGAVSFFLSIRFQVKERIKIREAEREEEEKRRREEEEFEEFEDESLQLNEMPAKEQFDNEQRKTDNEQKV